MKTYRTPHQLEHRRNMRRMRRAWRHDAAQPAPGAYRDMSLKAWAKDRSQFRDDLGSICAGWLQRKGAR